MGNSHSVSVTSGALLLTPIPTALRSAASGSEPLGPRPIPLSTGMGAQFPGMNFLGVDLRERVLERAQSMPVRRRQTSCAP